MDITKPNNTLKKLTELEFTEDRQLLRLAEEASISLSILNYELNRIPNKEIFLDTLYLQEAKQSNSIECYVTTNDEIYKAQANLEETREAKWVLQYRDAIREGDRLLKEKTMINAEDVINLHELIGASEPGIRKNSSRLQSSLTRIRNNKTGEIIYTPPHGEKLIRSLLDDTLEYVYNDDMYLNHPLVKIALAHCQFEKIHPFKDGNGRIGRIVNILFLAQKEYLCVPILYNSDYINKNKEDYYRFLKECGENGDYTAIIEFMLVSFRKAADKTLRIINSINKKVKQYTSKSELETFKGQMELLEIIVGEVFRRVYFRHEDLKEISYFDKEEQKIAIRYVNKDTVSS
jgi:Fic family protein